MSSSNGGWEYVGSKKSKPSVNKPSIPSGNDVKNKSTLLPELGIPDTGNTFQAFLDKELRKEERKQAKKAAALKQQAKLNKVNQPSGVSKGSNGGGGQKTKDGKASNEIKKKKSTSREDAVAGEDSPRGLEIALKSLAKDKIDSLVSTTTSHFPNSPLIWLKDLASYINSRVAQDPPDAVFSEKPYDYPFCLIKKEAQDSIFSLLGRCSPGSLQLFLDHCVHSMVTNLNNGKIPTAGYRVMAQALALKSPEIWSPNPSWFSELETAYSSQPQIVSTLLWTALQPCFYNIQLGLKIWLNIFKPLVGHKFYSKYVIQCLGLIVDVHCKSTEYKHPIDVRDFIPLMDYVFTLENDPVVSQKIVRQLIGNYLKLRDIIYTKQEYTVKTFFPSFLCRLLPSCPTNLKNEVLVNLVRCLKSNQQCFTVWKQMYKQNLVPSGLLLEYLDTNWGKKSAKIANLKAFHEALQSFQATNNEMIASKKKSDNIIQCDVHIKELLIKTRSKKSASKRPGLLYSTLLMSAIVGLIMFDCHINGSFKKSKTHFILERTHVLEYSKIAWDELERVLPPLYDKVTQFTGPYVDIAWQNVGEIATTLWNKAGPVKEWSDRAIPPLLEHFEDKIWPVVKDIAHRGLLQTVDLLVLCRDYSFEYGIKFGDWLETNVFTGSLSRENLGQILSNVTTSIGTYLNEAYLTTMSHYKTWIK